MRYTYQSPRRWFGLVPSRMNQSSFQFTSTCTYVAGGRFLLWFVMWSRAHDHVLSPLPAAATTGGGTENLSLNVIKILLQVCLTTLNVMCWLVPMKIRSFVESKRAISMANAFSGGVFLSLAFGEPIFAARIEARTNRASRQARHARSLSGACVHLFELYVL